MWNYKTMSIYPSICGRSMQWCICVGFDPKEPPPPPLLSKGPAESAGRWPGWIATENPWELFYEPGVFNISSSVWVKKVSTSDPNGKGWCTCTSRSACFSFQEYFFPSLFDLFLLHTLHCFHWLHVDDAATLENDWCDFYRRTGNIGHKTCLLYFPQPKKAPPLTFPVKEHGVCGKCVMYKEQVHKVSHTFLLRSCFLRHKYISTWHEKIRKRVGCDTISQPTLNIFLWF